MHCSSTSLQLTILRILITLGIAGFCALSNSLTSCSASAASNSVQSITVDGSAIASSFRYDGAGALSAGASSRLLINYPEPQRSQILDFLFKPGFGASLHILKVEIGGDTQSTDGSEPSHMHFRNDSGDCTRGYELWLLSQAVQRNPSIITWGLAWGVPGWIGNGSYFSDDNINYHIQWLKCVQRETGIIVDLVGIWNERYWGGADYVKSFRSALDSAGFHSTKISVPDNGFDDNLIQAMETDPDFVRAIHSLGVHYPCNSRLPERLQPFQSVSYWSSEDFSTVNNWAGASCWGRILNQNFVRMNITSTVAWSLIWSVYPNLPYEYNGLMNAFWPWSGHFEVNETIWTSAHYTQFIQPGWRILSTESGSSGWLELGGSFVTYVHSNDNVLKRPSVPLHSANAVDFSIVVETLTGDCLRCAGPVINDSQLIEVTLTNGLSAPRLYIWRTNRSEWLQLVDVVYPVNGTLFRLHVEQDTIYTITTTSGQARGAVSGIPQAVPFPSEYSEDFESYKLDTSPRFFADQAGAFSIAHAQEIDERSIGLMESTDHERAHVTNSSANKFLLQLSRVRPIEWSKNPFPTTLLGDSGWTDVKLLVRVRILEPPSSSSASMATTRFASDNVTFAMVCLRAARAWDPNSGDLPDGYCLHVFASGLWSLFNASNTPPLATGNLTSLSTNAHMSESESLKKFDPTEWLDLEFSVSGFLLSAAVDTHSLFLVHDNTIVSGMVAFGCGWHSAAFDDVRISAGTN